MTMEKKMLDGKLKKLDYNNYGNFGIIAEILKIFKYCYQEMFYWELIYEG
jgi:hypothetical protein